MSWTYAETSKDITPKDACDIVKEVWDIITVCVDETEWDVETSMMNIVGIVDWIKVAMECGQIRFANNGDLKWAIYHMLAEHHGGEGLGRKFASSRSCVPDRAVQLFREWLKTCS